MVWCFGGCCHENMPLPLGAPCCCFRLPDTAPWPEQCTSLGPPARHAKWPEQGLFVHPRRPQKQRCEQFAVVLCRAQPGLACASRSVVAIVPALFVHHRLGQVALPSRTNGCCPVHSQRHAKPLDLFPWVRFVSSVQVCRAIAPGSAGLTGSPYASYRSACMLCLQLHRRARPPRGRPIGLALQRFDFSIPIACLCRPPMLSISRSSILADPLPCHPV